MNKVILVLLCFTVIGCSAQQRLTRLKDRGENVVSIEVATDVKTAQKDIQEISKELKLIYLKNTETDTFVEVRHNNVTASIKIALFGSYGAGLDKLGFFFDYNKELNKTKITISEEVLSFDTPRRGSFIDKLKLRDIQRTELSRLK